MKHIHIAGNEHSICNTPTHIQVSTHTHTHSHTCTYCMSSPSLWCKANEWKQKLGMQQALPHSFPQNSQIFSFFPSRMLHGFSIRCRCVHFTWHGTPITDHRVTGPTRFNFSLHSSPLSSILFSACAFYIYLNYSRSHFHFLLHVDFDRFTLIGQAIARNATHFRIICERNCIRRWLIVWGNSIFSALFGIQCIQLRTWLGNIFQREGGELTSAPNARQ